jgi:hypothetical protein
MTAVEDKSITGQEAAKHAITEDLLEIEHQRAFAESLHRLEGYLDDHGSQDPSLGGIHVLGIDVAQKEHVMFSKGKDAPNFFQIVPTGEKHAASQVEFFDTKEQLISPRLCARIGIVGDEKSPYNYIVSNEGVFEVATHRPSTQERPDEWTAPHVIYATVPLSRSLSGDEWTKVSPIQVQRLSQKDEKTFMTNLVVLASNAIGEERAQQLLNFSPKQPNILA